MRRLVGGFAGEAGGRRDPAGVPAHHFHDEDLGRGLGHRGDIEARLEHRYGGVFGHRTEARAAVGYGEVVVDGLRYADHGHVMAHGLADLRDLVGRVGRVVAAVVEEPADVVGTEHIDQAFVLGAVLLDRLELEPARAERAAGGVTQCRNGAGRLFRGIDQLLAQGADDAVACGQHADLVLARGLDNGAGAGVDDGGDASGLRVEQIALHR